MRKTKQKTIAITVALPRDSTPGNIWPWDHEAINVITPITPAANKVESAFVETISGETVEGIVKGLEASKGEELTAEVDLAEGGGFATDPVATSGLRNGGLSSDSERKIATLPVRLAVPND